MFVAEGNKATFPRNEHVDIHVRTVTLAVGNDAPDPAKGKYLEIREFIKASGLYGQGIVIPLLQAKDLRCALDQVAQ